jgi:hypothetical protein
MKKTIRLTESELVELVQRIIKEDETMDYSPEPMSLSPQSKGGCRTTIGKLIKENPAINKGNMPRELVVSQITGPGGKVTRMSVGMDSIEEPIEVGTRISPRLTITLRDGTSILFNDVSNFGQATVECMNGKATLSLSTE